jgi:hypothetical protein
LLGLRVGEPQDRGQGEGPGAGGKEEVGGHRSYPLLIERI